MSYSRPSVCGCDLTFDGTFVYAVIVCCDLTLGGWHLLVQDI